VEFAQLTGRAQGLGQESHGELREAVVAERERLELRGQRGEQWLERADAALAQGVVGQVEVGHRGARECAAHNLQHVERLVGGPTGDNVREVGHANRGRMALDEHLGDPGCLATKTLGAQPELSRAALRLVRKQRSRALRREAFALAVD